MSSADTFRAVPAERDDAARRAEGRSVWILEREGSDTGVRIIHQHHAVDRKTASGYDYWYKIAGPFGARYVDNRDHTSAVQVAVSTLLDWERSLPKSKPSSPTKKGQAKR